MDKPPDKRIIGGLHEAFMERNDTCLYRGCMEKPIASHVVAEKTLKLIAENSGDMASKILTWDLPYGTLIKRIEARLPLEQFYFEPTPVGVGQASKVTCPLFCKEHDDTVFAPIEKREISPQPEPEQILLLAYRALCAATYDQERPERAFAVGEQHGERSTLNSPETLPKLQRFLARGELLDARQRHEQILSTQDYHQLDGKAYLLNIPPCIACTYVFVPSDPIDAMVTVNGKQILTAEDVLVLSFFPHPPLHSICIISWLRGSRRAHVFMDFNINPIPKEEQPEVFLSLGFQASDVYVSPIWWKSLNWEQREQYTKLHLSAGREFAHLVTASKQ